MFTTLSKNQPNKAADFLSRFTEKATTLLIDLHANEPDSATIVFELLIKKNANIAAEFLSHLTPEEASASLIDLQKKDHAAPANVFIVLAQKDIKKAAQIINRFPVTTTEGKELMTGVMSAITDINLQVNLIKEVCTLEIEKPNTAGTLLRDTTPASAMIKFFTTTHILPKFKESEALKDFLLKMPTDHLRTKDNKEWTITRKNKEQIKKLTNEYIVICTSLFSQGSNEMMLFKTILNHIQAECKKNNRFDDKVSNTATRNIAYLRFATTLLSIPSQVVNVTPVQTENGTILAKLVQKIANEKEDKTTEPYMEVLEDFVKEKREKGNVLDAMLLDPADIKRPIMTARSVYENGLIFQVLNTYAETLNRGKTTHFLARAFDAIAIEPENEPEKFYDALRQICDTHLEASSEEYVAFEANDSVENMAALKAIMATPAEEMDVEQMRAAKERLTNLVNSAEFAKEWASLWERFQTS